MKWLGKNIYSLESVFNSKTVFRGDIVFEANPVNINTTLSSNEDNLGSINVYSRDFNIFNDEVDSSADTTSGDPTIRLGSSLTECLEIHSNYQTSTTSMQIAVFKTLTASATADDGRFRFVVDEAPILEIDDGGINFWAGFVGGISFNGTDIITDNGSGTTTLKNIDALDATTTSTISSAISAGDITGVEAGDGLNGGGNSGSVTINLDAEQTNISSIYNAGLILGRDTDNQIDFATTDNKIYFKANGTDQIVLEDGALLPRTDNDIDLGSSSVKYKDGYFEGEVIATTFSGAVSGNVTGNCSGTAATVTGGTQASITTCANLTTVGTIGTGVWQGTAINQTYLSGQSGTNTGDVTLAGTPDYITISGQEITRNQIDLANDVTGVLPSANLDADTSHISTQRHMTFHGFTDDIDTTKQYIGLLDADSENTATTNGDLPFVVPNGGKLLKVFLRANSNRSGNQLTWTLETQDTSTTAGTGPSVIGAKTGAGCTNKTMTTYDFTTGLDSGVGSETNVINAGDMVFLAVESDSATSNTKFFITCLWELNLS